MSATTAIVRVTPGVAALLRAVGESLAARFSVCAVRGEISGFSRATSGHCYFNLKDDDGETAVLRCAMFRRAASLSNFVPADGQRVELRGRLAVYESRGELQFVVESIQRAGAGTLYEQFLAVKRRLEAEGLFDPQRKRPLPRWPTTVGVVTSLGGAVLHDIVTTLARRAAHVSVVVLPCLVQGPGAAASICAAIQASEARRDLDLLIVCRGGGSLEDLWAFNEESVVRAIARASLPVVSAVGHETDVTLADFAADLRAPTPTAAVELCAPSTMATLEQLAHFEARLERRVRSQLEGSAQRVDRLAERLARPGQRVRQRREWLVHAGHRLDVALRRTTEQRAARLGRLGPELDRALVLQSRRQSSQLDHLEARLRALDPRRVLARGFVWLADASGEPVMSVRQVVVGERLSAVLLDGTASVRVDGVESLEGLQAG